MEPLVQDLLAFIRRSPNALFAAADAASQLQAAGYQPLEEDAPWKLAAGGRYVVRRGGAIAAFALPQHTKDAHFQIFAAHGDSPALRVKTAWKLADGWYVRLNAETYGGGIWGSWADRPLSVAGRVTVRTPQGGCRVLPVNIERDLLMLPSLPIHFNRAVNDGVRIDPQADLCPVLAAGQDASLEELLAQAAGVRAGDILSHELTVYCRSEGLCWGREGEFVSAPRLDDLECAFAGLWGLLHSEAGGAVNLWACLDDEETGSATREGAGGTFLSDTLERIAAALGWSRSEFLAAQARSFLLSADNAHALHPAHPELYDAHNRVALNGGVVLKHAVAYATDGETEGILQALAQACGQRLQHFANRSNIRGGSTLANIAATRLNIRMADIGLAQLAMHAAYETAGAKDLASMAALAAGFFEHTLCRQGQGDFLWRA